MKRCTMCLVVILSLFLLASCDEDKNKDIPDTSQALANYWESQTNLTGSLETRDGVMNEIQQKINDLGTAKSRDAIDEIDALVNDYIQKSAAAASYFDAMRDLEDNIRPYGDEKGFFGNVARGIYNKASGAVISSGRMVRSGWRVLSGSQSLRQVLNDPESGIPIISSFAADLQKHNADRDAVIRQSILNGDSQEGWVPINSLPGDTMEEKANAYLNLSEEDPLKLEARRDVMLWDADERMRTANTAKKLGETGVKIVGDAYGGGAGEWTNEVLLQHMDSNQDPEDKGSMEIKVRSDEAGNPSIEGPKTVIIDKVNTPDSDPRVTIIMDAPESFEQELPSGDYNIIAVADEFIRNVEGAVAVIQSELTQQVNNLLKLAENAIIIEGISANSDVITLGQTAQIDLVCAGTLGQDLEFNWEITGGAYTSMNANKNSLSFKPSVEGEYSVACEVSDSFGNTKHASLSLSAIDAHLSFQQYEITAEEINDDKLNPGELATMRFYITNTGENDLIGTTALEPRGGVQVGFQNSTAEIPAGETAQFLANVQLPATYSEANAWLDFKYLVQDQSENPVVISIPIQIPVDFYVELDTIESPVTDRVLTIRGTVANPMLASAHLIIDSDSQQAYDVQLSNGRFSQQIIVNSSSAEEEHSVYLSAVSGSLEASDTISFTSQVPPTALRTTLTWDTGGTDVDLWVTDPNGEKCYYANRYTASGLELDFDDTNGYGPENITTTNIIPGDYLVQAHYYSDHDYENAIGTNCVVVIRLNEGTPEETANNYYGYLNDSGDLWTVTVLSFNGSTWQIKELDQKSIVDSNQLPEK